MESKFLVHRNKDDKDNAHNSETRSFKVAKPDFSKSSTREDFGDTLQRREKYSHLKFDVNGRLKPSSVLGNVQDFLKYASDDEKSGEVLVGPKLPRASTSKSGRPHTVTIMLDDVHQGQQPPKTAPTKQIFDQTNALSNWQQKMAERKRIHGRISELVPRKDGATSLMNSADGQRKINETRMDIDKAIPAIDYGKGFRSGSEFWRLHENIGDDVSGLKMTLTKSERGMGESHIERISKPSDIIKETTSDNPKSSHRQRFFDNPYLRDRMHQLDPVMVREHAIEPGLLVRGSSRPTQTAPEAKLKTSPAGQTPFKSDHGRLSGKYMTSTPAIDQNSPFAGLRDVVPAHSIAHNVFVGPILKINHNQVARYSEHHHNIEERVLLQTNANGQVTRSTLALENIGSTRIKFHFRRIDNDGISMDPPRFFFNRLGGCVLPGETAEFPFQFKSHKPGIFTESWELVTEPQLLSGGKMHVRLYAIAYDTDEMKEKRENVSQMLQTRESGAAAKSAFDKMLNIAFTRSEEKAHFGDLSFAKNNAKTRFDYSNARWQGKVDFAYRHDDVDRLCMIWKRYSAEGEEWDFDIAALKERVADAEEDDNVEEDLKQINDVVNNLRKNTLVQERRQTLLTIDRYKEYKIMATGMFGQMIYKLVDAAHNMKTTMKLETGDEKKSRPDSEKKIERPNSNSDKSSRGGTRESQRSNRSTTSKINLQKTQAAEPPTPPVKQVIPEYEEPIIESAIDLQERQKQFTERLHTVGESLFSSFIESLLESFGGR